MADRVNRKDVQLSVVAMVEVFGRLLDEAPLFVISRDSMRVLVTELGVRLAESWNAETERDLLANWNRDVDKFREAWVRAAKKNPRVTVAGQDVLLINEDATGAALRLCPPGPQQLASH